jgi:hypothetical protein
VLTERWTQLDDHAEQLRLVNSKARFCVVSAGRRSGKTERGKRRIVRRAMAGISGVSNATFAAAAPTRDQAKRIFWRDLKALSPREWVESISESELTIHYKTGSQLVVVGLDRPQRIEGIPLDGILIDEIAEVKRESWEQSIRPALSTRGRPPGWAWFTGRPKGRGMFYELFSRAGVREGWDSFTWTSATILAPEEIAQAKEDLDPLTFAQEYEAQWVTFEGLAYYQWNPTKHLRNLAIDPNLPLILAFDFNVDPGICAAIQEQFHDSETMTCVVGEVHIPRNSNTPAVCRKIIEKWGKHPSDVHIYGDPAGGARHTSQIGGSDWDLVREVLKPAFGDRMRWRVASAHPPVRDRINCVNSRLCSTTGIVRMAVDPSPSGAPNVVRDFEGVTLLEGGSGEIDKKKCERQGLTHLSDAIGYYIHERHPIEGRVSYTD